MTHATQEQLLRFSTGKLAEGATMELYAHLAECDRCLKRVRALKALRSDLSTYWERWMEHYGEIARTQFPEVAAALEGARREVRTAGAGYEIAARVVIEAAKKIVAIGSRGLTEWMEGERQPYTFALQRPYAGVGEPKKVQGADSWITEGAELLGEGEVEEACARFENAVRVLPRSMEKAEMNVTDERNEKVVCLHLNARRRVVSVLLYGKERMAVPWVAVLTTPDGDEIESKPMTPVPGAAYLLSEFVGVDDGEYVVAVREG